MTINPDQLKIEVEKWNATGGSTKNDKETKSFYLLTIFVLQTIFTPQYMLSILFHL